MASLLVAVAVSLGYALAAVPNIELMTVTVFISGFLLGSGFGAVIGAASMVLFSIFNPLGAALPPVLVAQAAGQTVVGLAGGLFGPTVAGLDRRWRAVTVAGILGLVLTVVYDGVTSVGAYFVIAGDKNLISLSKFVAGGVLFVGIHIMWNAMTFAVALKPILNVLKPYRREMSEK